MGLARFKDLCLDVTEKSDDMGRFWATATGLTYEPDDEAGSLVDEDPSRRIWLNLVPEARTTKNRVHLDVHTTDLDELLAAGATVVDGYPDDAWQVMADPEGGEFCAFVREQAPDYRVFEMIVDSADPDAISGWWADVFGAQVDGDRDKGWRWITDVPGLPFDSIDFIPVPEPKTVRNRVHWDVTVDSPAAIDDLVRRGASRLPGYPDDEWVVLADPEGNEFCVFVRA